MFNRVVVLNYSDYSYILERNIAPFSTLKVIPGTGLNFDHFSPTKLTSYGRHHGLTNHKYTRNFTFAYFGRISQEKGFYRYIASIQYIRNSFDISSELTFLVVCPQTDIDAFSASDHTFFTSIGVRFRPYVPEPMSYYCLVDAVVIPTMYGEGLSRVGLECAALGIPVVGFSNRGLEGVIVNGVNGILLESYSPYCLAVAMFNIYSNIDSYAKDARLHRDDLAKQYSDSSSLSAFAAVIESMIHER